MTSDLLQTVVGTDVGIESVGRIRAVGVVTWGPSLSTMRIQRHDTIITRCES